MTSQGRREIAMSGKWIKFAAAAFVVAAVSVGFTQERGGAGGRQVAPGGRGRGVPAT